MKCTLYYNNSNNKASPMPLGLLPAIRWWW